MFLALTTDKIQITTSAAIALDVHVSFADLSGTTVTPGKQNTAISTATTTDVLAAPAASTYRRVKYMSARNKGAASQDVTILFNANGTTYEIHKVTVLAGEMLQFIEGLGFFTYASSSGDLYKALDANANGIDSTSAQPWFPTAGAVTVEAGVRYLMRGYLRTSRSAGAVAHTTSLLFAGTASLTTIAYRAMVNAGDVVTNAAWNQTASEVATAVVIKASSTSTSEQVAVHVDGLVQINAAGTFIPQFQYSGAPGQVPSILKGTYFAMTKLAAGATRGTWA